MIKMYAEPRGKKAPSNLTGAQQRLANQREGPARGAGRPGLSPLRGAGFGRG